MTADKIKIALDYQNSINDLSDFKETVLRDLTKQSERFGVSFRSSMVSNSDIAEYIDAARKSFTEKIDKDIQFFQQQLDNL